MAVKILVARPNEYYDQNILQEVFRYLASYFISATMRDWCKIKQTYIYLFVFFILAKKS